MSPDRRHPGGAVFGVPTGLKNVDNSPDPLEPPCMIRISWPLDRVLRRFCRAQTRSGAASSGAMVGRKRVRGAPILVRGAGAPHPTQIYKCHNRVSRITIAVEAASVARAAGVQERFLSDGRNCCRDFARLSANILRRHMTKGQQAMAVAMIYPEPEKRILVRLSGSGASSGGHGRNSIRSFDGGRGGRCRGGCRI